MNTKKPQVNYILFSHEDWKTKNGAKKQKPQIFTSTQDMKIIKTRCLGE